MKSFQNSSSLEKKNNENIIKWLLTQLLISPETWKEFRYNCISLNNWGFEICMLTENDINKVTTSVYFGWNSRFREKIPQISQFGGLSWFSGKSVGFWVRPDKSVPSDRWKSYLPCRFAVKIRNLLQVHLLNIWYYQILFYEVKRQGETRHSHCTLKAVAYNIIKCLEHKSCLITWVHCHYHSSEVLLPTCNESGNIGS